MWKCSDPDCDSKKFIRNDSGSCKYYEINYVDETGSVIDTRDIDYEDHEIEDVGDEVECVECGNYGVFVEDTPKKVKWKDKIGD